MCYWNNKLFNNLLSVLLKVWEDPPPQGHHLSQVPRTILSLGKEKLKMDHLRWVLHHRGQWPDISAHNNVPSLFPTYWFYIWLMCYLFSFVADIKKSVINNLPSKLNEYKLIYFFHGFPALSCLTLILLELLVQASSVSTLHSSCGESLWSSAPVRPAVWSSACQHAADDQSDGQHAGWLHCTIPCRPRLW